LSKPIIPLVALCAATLVRGPDPAFAEGCLFEPQGEGRVAEIIDGRSFRLTDGREVRLAGIESAGDETTKAHRAAALAALIAGRDVSLLLRAATLPGAELVLPLLAATRLLDAGALAGRLPVG